MHQLYCKRIAEKIVYVSSVTYFDGFCTFRVILTIHFINSNLYAKRWNDDWTQTNYMKRNVIKVPLHFATGSLPGRGETVDVKACVLGLWEDCEDPFTIRIQNCGDYNLYYLRPTQSCPEAYCFGKWTWHFSKVHTKQTRSISIHKVWYVFLCD